METIDTNDENSTIITTEFVNYTEPQVSMFFKDFDKNEQSDSSSESVHGENDLKTAAMNNEITAKLAAAGTVGMAAAAAVVSSKKRKYRHYFETDPAVRKRQQTRLLKKLQKTINEFVIRGGQQAIVLIATPRKPNPIYRVFGAKPLSGVINNFKPTIIENLENELAQHIPESTIPNPELYELPPLVVDGIPTPVEKMTQSQLRTFIPLMLKYSTGRGKPGWGKDSTKPPWWPEDIPWANVRLDARTDAEKQIPWTQALRTIVTTCYKYHRREDLLTVFGETDNDTGNDTVINYSDELVNLIQVEANNPTITVPNGTVAYVPETMHRVQMDPNGEEKKEAERTLLNSITGATVSQDGQVILTCENGQSYPMTVSRVFTLPASEESNQTTENNIQLFYTNDESALFALPVYSSSNEECSTDPKNMKKIVPDMIEQMPQISGNNISLVPEIIPLQKFSNDVTSELIIGN